MKKISVSVIIPVYNRRIFIQNAVDCLRSQTLADIEFIIVDDGSTDGAYEYLIKKTKSDKRFKIYKMAENSGPSVARNFALKHAKGKYIGFFDIDDEIPANYFEALLNTAEENKSDIVFTSYNNIPHQKIGNINILADKIGCLRNGSLWDKLFAASLIKKHNLMFCVGRYCADNLFVFTAFYYAQQITLCNQPTYKYVLQPDSIGVDIKKQKKRKADALAVTEQLMKFIKHNDFDKKSYDACYHFLTKSLNSYRLDKEFCRTFDKLTKQIRPKSGVVIHKTIKGSMTMMFLKLKRILGMVSRDKYGECVLLHKIKQSGLFDKKWYLKTYPDVAAAKMNPVQHYLKFGWTEGRNPSPRFDNNAYLNMYTDVAAAKMCPLVHYIRFGRAEGRSIRSVTAGTTKMHVKRNLGEKIAYAWEYPVRVHEKYHQLKDEIRKLKHGK